MCGGGGSDIHVHVHVNESAYSLCQSSKDRCYGFTDQMYTCYSGYACKKANENGILLSMCLSNTICMHATLYIHVGIWSGCRQWR